jgi:gamma-glutamyltranspeptidase/glutathione hydrolase
MYQDDKGNVIPGLSILGYKSVAVPGSVAGMVYAQQHWGKLSLKQVMEPAIRLARDGFVLDYDEARDFEDSDLSKFPESRRIFQRDGKFYQAGEVFQQPELARTLQRISDNPDDFYHGSLARELASAIQKGGGLVTAEDLAQYEVKERTAIRGTYRDTTSSARRRRRRVA